MGKKKKKNNTTNNEIIVENKNITSILNEDINDKTKNIQTNEKNQMNVDSNEKIDNSTNSIKISTKKVDNKKIEKNAKNTDLEKDKEEKNENIDNIKETKKDKINKEEKVKKEFFKDTFFKNTIFVTLYLFAIEIIFRVISRFEIISYSSLRILLSTFIIAIIFTTISSLTKRKGLRNLILLLLIFIYTAYSWAQLGFINYLGVYISFHTSSQFGAVKDYIFDFLMSFKIYYYLIFMPFIIAFIDYVILERKKEYTKPRIGLGTIKYLIVLIIVILLYYGTLVIPFMQNDLQIKSNKKLFKSPDVPTVAVNQFGPIIFGVLDFKTYIFPIEEEFEEPYNNSTTDEPQEPVSREVSKALEEIAKGETNKKYKNLNNYFASQKITDYNDYTGMFEGKNIIVILMESVNEAIINEEYYPNFTKLYNEGWHWTNSYSPRNSCATGNNEFSAMTGLFSIYNTCTSNVYKNNTYFEAIFNLFNNKGYTTRSMHDFVEWYYYRKTIHPNMGSGKYYNATSLGIKTASYYGEWPSDEEFFEKAMDIVLSDDGDKPTMTWLTTVTSHQPYSNSSTYGDLYKDYFKGEGYSTSVSRYLSKLKVLDNAIGILIDRLENENKLNDTVIVMLADHYPYGLNKSQVAEMIPYDLSDYDIEKTPFVIYNPEMTPQTFTEYTSYINLIPTIANLMNLEYDPRLYMGTDLLSEDYTSRVIFADGSWKNEIAYYNASTSKIKYYTDEVYTSEEIQAINNEVSLKIQMSSNAIKNNYFNYLGKKINEWEDANIMVDTDIVLPSIEEYEENNSEDTNE